jgi:hypothetical protein
MRRAFRRIQKTTAEFLGAPAAFYDLKDLVLLEATKTAQAAHANPLNRRGYKCFSQGDEDGITLEILRRIDSLGSGVFAEFGVGDGMENNTLILAALGWSGLWVGGEKLQFDLNDNSGNSYAYIREWITRENIVPLAVSGLARIGAESPDVVSLDLDGNDIYLVEKLLQSGFRPRLFIVEYNAKFPPPVRFQIAYDAGHRWGGDDYFGASLMTFNDLFSNLGYRLVCCNSQTGSNAFFLDSKYSESFMDVPIDIGQLYCEPRYHRYKYHGLKQSVRTIKKILRVEEFRAR